MGQFTGVILFIFFVNYIIEWSPRRLILTDRALYFRGLFVGQYATLDGIHEARDDKRALVVTLPPDNYWKFRVGGCHARRLARAISDAGMSEFVRQLEYKCAWYGAGFVRLDRWYPSSKTCSRCGAVKQSLLLSERTYRCNRCGFECDRDENAARNIQAYTGHSEPARHRNEFPGPARSAGGERDVETCKPHRREACARSVKRLPDSQPPCSAIAPDCGRLA